MKKRRLALKVPSYTNIANLYLSYCNAHTRPANEREVFNFFYMVRHFFCKPIRDVMHSSLSG